MARILVAEDDAHMLRIISMWLQRNGHDVCEVPDGLAAREQLTDGRFDVLVSDVNMPGMDGISLVRWLRLDQESQLPVILLSSRCDQQVISEQVKPFKVEVYPKPFSPSQLVSRIERKLAESQGDGVGHPTSGAGDPGRKGERESVK